MTKTSDLSKLRSFFNNITKEKTVSALRSFFMGKWYPIWVAFSVLIGRFTCTELYFAMLEFVLVSVAILVCDSIRPLLPNLITFLYRMPLEHSPGSPIYSKYYKGEKMIVFAIFAAVFFITLIFFFIKSKSFSGVNFLKLPLFIPTAIFAFTFIIAGIFSENRQSKDLYFTLLQAFVFL